MEINTEGIIIVSSPRSGGTNLMKSISSFYNKKYYFEPDITKNQVEFNYKKDVVKYIPYHIDWIDNEELYDYDKILDKISKFKNIILLDRKNKEHQAESFYHLIHYGTYYKNWIPTKINKNENEYRKIKQFLYRTSYVIEKLSKDLNISINYYEDVYLHKKINNENIKLDLQFFDKKYKLRKNQKNII